MIYPARAFSTFLIAAFSTLINPAQAQATDPEPTESFAQSCLPAWILPPVEIPGESSPTEIGGLQLSQPKSQQYQLTGDAFLTQPGLVLSADQLFYDQQTEQAQALGSVQLQQTDMLLIGEQADFNQQTQQGLVLDLRFQFKDASRAHGVAKSLEFDQIAEISQLEKSTYTSCPLDDQAWLLHFKKLEINNQKRRLYGKHTWLEFKKIPVIYTPYINFPLDDRASGLLFPKFGSYKSAAQENSSAVFAQPYYFNLATNYDDTLTPIWIERRGVALDNEFRYLRPKHQGIFSVTHLNDQLAKHGLIYAQRNGDIVADQAVTDRWRAHFKGSQNWGNGWRSSINWHEVSDPDFFNDIPLSYGSSETSSDWRNETQIERSLRLSYRQGPFQAHLAHLGYLPVRHGERNILEKTPEIGFNFGQSFGKFYANIYAENAEFKRFSGFNNFVDDWRVRPLSASKTQPNKNGFHQGRRSYLEPSLVYRIDKPYGFLQSQVQANIRQYSLNNTADSQVETNSVMQYALRGGLVFERDLNLFGNQLVQTLEPEIQWLKVPYVKQQHLKTFDSAAASLDFSNLFALNRFSGFDRIGDTEQVSLAINNRVLSELGRPLADFAVGQIFYLRDRQITLKQDQLQDDDRSDYFMKAGLQLPNVYFSSTNQFDKDDLVWSQTLNRLRINSSNKVELLAVHQGLNLQNRATAKQSVGAGAILQLNDKWQFASYLNLDIEASQKRELYTGLRYESCCWAAELVYEKYQHTDNNYNESIKFMIELKGLSSSTGRFSNRIRETLNF